MDYYGRTNWQSIRMGARIVTVKSRAWVVWKYRTIWLAKPLLSKGGASYKDTHLRSLLKTLSETK